MTFSFPASFAHHYSAYRSAFHRKPAAWLAYGFFLGLPVVIVVLAVVLRGYTLEEIWAEEWHLLVWGPLFVVVGVPLLHRMNVRQQRAGNASLSGEQHVDINEDGLRAWGALTNTSVLWPAVAEVVELREFFLFYLSAAHFLYLPKSAVPSPEALVELRSLLTRHLAGRVKLRRAAA